MMHVQCKVSKGDQIDVVWIEERGAKIGNVVKLKIDDNWEDGWKVEETYNKLPSDYIKSHRDDHKYHRNNTDI